jgi:hypothetical protein
LNLAGIDDTGLYWAIGDKIRSVSLLNGKSLARFSVPGIEQSSWKVQALKSALLLHPTRATARSSQASLLSGDLNWTRLIGLIESRYDGWMSRTLPVLVIDKENGQVLQRFSLPGTGPAASVGMLRDGFYAFTGERAYWLSSKEEATKKP